MGQRVKRRPESEWSTLVQQWQSSGRSAEAFSAENAVSVARLQWWDAELRRRSARAVPRKGGAAKPAFAELRVVAPSARTTPGIVEVHARSGWVVRVQGRVEDAVLVSVLRAVSQC
jgi:hypothetical protein